MEEYKSENIEIPMEMRDKLAPMIVRSITDKLNKSGVKVSENDIQKYVDDPKIKIEIPAVIFRDPEELPPHIPIHVCTLIDFRKLGEKISGGTVILGA